MAEVSSEIESTLMASSSHPETPPPSPINEHQTEAKIEYTEAATLRLNSSRKRRSAADTESSSDCPPVPPVEYREPSEPITKAPTRQHSGQDDIELQVLQDSIETVGDYPIDEERSTGESDAASAGTASAKSTQRLISSKLDDYDPDDFLNNFFMGCCTCLGFCFT